MKLENLVASQSLCEEFAKRWPEEMNDSAYVYHMSVGGDMLIYRREQVALISLTQKIPAPTLEEIMGQLPSGTTVHFDFTLSCWLVTLPDRSTWQGDDEKASDAALRMLMKVKEGK